MSNVTTSAGRSDSAAPSSVPNSSLYDTEIVHFLISTSYQGIGNLFVHYGPAVQQSLYQSALVSCLHFYRR
jgi:hypothetical protein